MTDVQKLAAYQRTIVWQLAGLAAVGVGVIALAGWLVIGPMFARVDQRLLSAEIRVRYLEMVTCADSVTSALAHCDRAGY